MDDPFGKPASVAAPVGDPFGKAPPTGATNPVQGLIDYTTDAAKREGAAFGHSFMTGAADVIETLDQPGKWLLGDNKGHKGVLGHEEDQPQEVADWFRQNAPAVIPGKGFLQGAQNFVAGTAGGLPSGALEWSMGVGFAGLHGVHSAEEHAEAQGRQATAGEMAFDAIVEASLRKFQGGIAERKMGALPTGLAFGGSQGLQDVAENQAANIAGGKKVGVTAQQAQEEATSVGVNFVIGAVGGHLSVKDKADLNAALTAARAGDSKGAMAHLNPVLLAHSDKVAAAARNLGVDVEHEAVPPKEERLPTPQGDHNVKTVTRASLATRRAHQERMDAQARARMVGWEEKWHNVPDAERMQAITAYQRGEPIPEHYAEFFKNFDQIMADQAAMEHAAGIEYDVRENYAAGYWKDPEKAQSHYSGNPRSTDPVYARPGFTRAKGFEDYQEGIEAGFVPKTTNPAVIAAMRIEAGNAAIARRLAIRDLTSDGLAVPTKEETKVAREGLAAKRGEVKAAELDQLVKQGMAREVSEINANRKQEGLPQVKGNARAGGKEYVVNDDALEQLRGKLGRMTKRPHMPKETKDWTKVQIGGAEYAVEPKAARMLANGFGQTQRANGLLAEWGGNLYHGWMGLRNVTIPLTLSFSAYHALHILGIDVAQPIAAAIKTGLDKGMDADSFVDAVRDGWDDKTRDVTGRRVGEDYEKPDKELTPTERLEQNLMLAGGFAPRMPSFYEIRAGQELRRTMHDVIPSIQQEAAAQGWTALRALGVGQAMTRATFLSLGHIIEKLQGPLFDHFIPQLKTAAYLNEAKLLLNSHPELLAGTPEANAQMRVKLREIADSMDNRFGQMQYDKLFWPRLVQQAMVGTFLSAGWNLGFLREYGRGLTTDIGGTIRGETNPLTGQKVHEVNARTVYAATYMGVAMIVSGLMTYMMTGQPPTEPKDYIYPKLPDGSRENTMWFSREFGAIFYHLRDAGAFDGPVITRPGAAVKGAGDLVTSKMQESIPALMEALTNQDYFGNQIYDPNGTSMKILQQQAAHVAAGLTMPITLQGILSHPDESVDTAAMGGAGFNPAAKYVERTAIQSDIVRAYKQQYPTHVTAFGDVARSAAKNHLRGLYKAMEANPEDTDASQAFWDGLAQYQQAYRERVSAPSLSATAITKSWDFPEYASMFQRLDEDTQSSLLKQMSPEERQTYLPFARNIVKMGFQ